MGNLSLRTFFNIFFFIRKFSYFRICSNLVGFNRINSIEFLLNVHNQLIRENKYPRNAFIFDSRKLVPAKISTFKVVNIYLFILVYCMPHGY